MPNDKPVSKLPISIGPPRPHPAIRALRRHTQGQPFTGEAFPLPGATAPAIYPRPPHVEPPSGAFHFDELAPLTLIAAGASAVLLVVTIPAGYNAVVRHFGQNADDFSIVTWRFLINGAPVRPFSDLRAQVGTLIVPSHVTVELTPRDVFSILAVNTGAIGVNIAARIGGWFWPI